MDKALQLLSFRARSESELEDRLRRSGHPPEATAHALRRCRELGYLDDRAYAEAHVRDRLRLRPRGRRALRTELYRKGISPDLTETAINEAFAEFGVDETTIALRLARKHLRRMGAVETTVARRRLAGLLGRRGFPPPVVWETIDRALADHEEPDAHPRVD